MNVKELVEEYGKQLIRELIDTWLICRRTGGSDIRPILIKHKVIKPTTRMIITNVYRVDQTGRLPDGSWGQTGEIFNRLYIKNGRNQHILNIEFNDSELPLVRELLEDDKVEEVG